MSIDPSAIHRLLGRLPQQRSLDAVLELFSALGYQYADELPLPTRTWPEGAQQVLDGSANSPIYLAQHRDLYVIYTHLTTDHLARTVERPIVEQTLHKLHPFALFVFANKDRSQWDFVNVKYVAEDGDRRRTIRRIHVGQDERLHTAAQRMALLAVPAPDTSPLELQTLHDQAFDVEEVTRQFYRDYVGVFSQLCDDIARRNPRRREEAETEAQLLLDRLMFLYFIQKKGWLDGRRDYLYQRFQARHEAQPGGTDFYSDVLVPLFVALSNEGMAFPGLGEIPFLNGGLFEVSSDTTLADHLVLGNAVFRAVFDDLLECYNFTVREDTPLDVEVAIDPEMLGQVFENLVLGLERGEDRRKATGSYYTPRVIVHFMCRQALKEYLAAESDLEAERIEALMEVGPAEQLTPEEVAGLREMVSEPQARLLRGLVEKARVLDPAVGSGAFLVGMLYEMVALSKLLDVRLHGQKRVRRRNYDYDLKRSFIERTLYGVDIQPEAVRICELRLWLSLMVEYERKASEAVPTLPNLSYRVRVGDSLIERLFGEPVQLDELADDAVARQLIDRIQAEKRAYFQEPDLAEKQRRELHILGLLCELAAKLIGAKRGAVLQRRSAEVPGLFGEFAGGLLTDRQKKAKQEIEAELARYDALMERVKGVYERVQAMQDGSASLETRDVRVLREELGLSFIWRMDFAEVFAEKTGFDVVIGNPPYVRVHKLEPQTKKLLWQQFSTFVKKADLYACFIERGISLLKHNGSFAFITSNGWLRLDSYERLRTLLLEHTALRTIVDFTDNVFDTATVKTSILLLSRRRIDDRGVRVATVETASDLTGHGFRGIDQASFTGTYKSILDPSLEESHEAIKRKMRAKGAPLGRVFSISFGLKTGDDSRFLTYSSTTPEHQPLLRGADVHRYTTEFKGEYVWYAPSRMKAHRRTARPGTAGRFEQPKVLVRDTGEGLQCTFDGEDYYVKDVLIVADRKKGSNRLKTLTGLLNSRLMKWYYETSFPTLHVQRNELASLPIYAPGPDQPVDSTRQNTLIALVERMLALHRELIGAPVVRRAELEQQIAATDAEIDALVYELYGLTDEEIGIVEGRGG